MDWATGLAQGSARASAPAGGFSSVRGGPEVLRSIRVLTACSSARVGENAWGRVQGHATGYVEGTPGSRPILPGSCQRARRPGGSPASSRPDPVPVPPVPAAVTRLWSPGSEVPDVLVSGVPGLRCAPLQHRCGSRRPGSEPISRARCRGAEPAAAAAGPGLAAATRSWRCRMGRGRAPDEGPGGLPADRPLARGAPLDLPIRPARRPDGGALRREPPRRWRELRAPQRQLACPVVFPRTVVDVLRRRRVVAHVDLSPEKGWAGLSDTPAA